MSAFPELISRYPQWEQQLLQLHTCAAQCGMEKTVKWGIPVFTYNKKNILGIAAFKSYVGIWFYEGALLADKEKVLVNAQEGKTKRMRQWRFTAEEQIPVATVKAYMKEAMRLSGQAATAPVDKQSIKLEIPQELEQALQQNPAAAQIFKELAPSHRREYANYVREAKQLTTRIRRAEKSISLILQKKGLFDTYKK